MRGGERLRDVLVARGVEADAVAQPGRDPGFVQRDPERDRVRERLVDYASVLGEPLARLPYGPPATVLERLRQVPVVEGEHRLYGALPKSVYEPTVVVQSLLVRRATTVGLNPRPGDGETVSLQPEARHEVEVIFDAVILVAGDVSCVAAVDLAWGMGERVPDGGTASILVHGTLDLVRGRRRPPQEVIGKIHLVSFSSGFRSRATGFRNC